MTKYFLFMFFGCIMLKSATVLNSEQLVTDFNTASNTYQTEQIVKLIDANYQEVFIDGSVEIANIEQLKETIAWRKILESKSEILSIKSVKDTVITTEKLSHIMDDILQRKPRTFKISYIIKRNKILKTIIDTVPGYSKITKYNFSKFQEFQEYCQQNNLDYQVPMTAEGASILKASLMQYKNRD